MVQVLEGVPSFGTSLARNLGAGITRGVDQQLDFRNKMALQKQKQQSLLDIFGGGGGSQGSGQPGEEGGMGEFKPLGPQQKAMLAIVNPSAFKAYETLEAHHKEDQEKVKAHEDIGLVLNSMSDTLKGGKLGYTPSRKLTAQGRRDAQYFDSLGVQLESIAKDLISKGVLARDRFAYLLSNLPSAGKSDAENAGAIEAWADALKIERPEGLESFYKNEKGVSKPKASARPEMKQSHEKKVLDRETMLKLMKKTQGDKEKAKQVAKKMGYDVE